MTIVVQGCEKHRDRWKAQRETWAKDALFFTGPGLGVPDDYESLPLKHKAMMKALRHEDFVFKCDSDTYVHVPRLLASGYEKHDFIGHENPDYPGCPFGGPGYWLSKKAMNILADAEWPSDTIHDDLLVGRILKDHGIHLHHDPRYALYQDVLPDNDVISRHLSSREPFRTEMMYEAHRLAYA